jgi:hypothetical protein
MLVKSTSADVIGRKAALFIFILAAGLANMVSKNIQSTLCTTATLGTPNLGQLMTGGRCSKVDLCNIVLNWDFTMVVAVGRWSFAQV